MCDFVRGGKGSSVRGCALLPASSSNVSPLAMFLMFQYKLLLHIDVVVNVDESQSHARNKCLGVTFPPLGLCSVTISVMLFPESDNLVAYHQYLTLLSLRST